MSQREIKEKSWWRCKKCNFINDNFGYMKDLCRNLDCRKWREEEIKEKRIKVWAVINKLSGYILWGKYGYFILMSKKAADERMAEEPIKRNLKVVPCEIKILCPKKN